MTALFPADFQKTKMINLLPPLRQKQIADEEAAKTVAIIVMTAAAALLFFAATLFVIRIFYQYELKNAEILLEEKKVIAGMRDVSAVESQIALGNVLAAEITGFDRRQTKITEVFFARCRNVCPRGLICPVFNFRKTGLMLRESLLIAIFWRCLRKIWKAGRILPKSSFRRPIGCRPVI